MITAVVSALHQEAFVGTALYTTQYPRSSDLSASVILPLAEEGFVYLNNSSRSSNHSICSVEDPPPCSFLSSRIYSSLLSTVSHLLLLSGTQRFLLKWDSTLRNRVRLIRLPLRILFLLIDAW